jgi:hypothetical protein
MTLIVRTISGGNTASPRMDKTPLSFRIDFTLRLGSKSIDPILMSRIRRGAGGVEVSVVE